MFAKIVNGIINFAPREVIIQDKIVKFPTEEQLKSIGYLPVTFTVCPIAPDGYIYIDEWEQTNNEIVQKWVLIEHQEDIDDTKALNILLGGDIE